MEKVLPTEIINEISNLKELEDLGLISNEFKRINELSEKDDEKINEFLFDGKIPDKEYINKFKLSNIGIQLSLVQLAKKLAAKVQLIEKHLSKIEDIIYSENTLNEMKPKELIALYSSTRMLFDKSFDMLTKIREKIDFDEIETFIKIINTKKEIDEKTENFETIDIDEIMKELKNKKLKKVKENE